MWLEVARVAWLEEFAGGYRAIRERGIEALTTGLTVTYERAAVFDDVLTVWVRLVDVRGARFRYEYVIERQGARIAHGATMHATVDATSRRPIRVPPWFADAVVRAAARTAAPPPPPAPS